MHPPTTLPLPGSVPPGLRDLLATTARPAQRTAVIEGPYREPNLVKELGRINARFG